MMGRVFGFSGTTWQDEVRRVLLSVFTGRALGGAGLAGARSPEAPDRGRALAFAGA